MVVWYILCLYIDLYEDFMPWLMESTAKDMEMQYLARVMMDDMITNVRRANRYCREHKLLTSSQQWRLQWY